MTEENAPPDSVLGQLQRGRGIGYLRLLQEPRAKAHRMLTDCILHDPRMDHQCESRGDYYACLALALELPLDPVASHLQIRGRSKDDPWWEIKLTIDTLGALTRRGSKAAANILCDYLPWGEDWTHPLDDLVASNDPDVHRQAAQAIEHRFPTTEGLREALDWEDLDDVPWRTLSLHSPRIRSVAEQTNSRSRNGTDYDAYRKEPEGMTVRQLLDLAREKKRWDLRKFMEEVVKPADLEFLKSQVVMDQREVATIAMWGIAKVATPDLFDWLLDTYTARPQIWHLIGRAFTEAMTALPPETTLPLGRLWLNHADEHRQSMAEKILAAHAWVEDLPLLGAALRDALDGEPYTSYRIENLATAIGHLSGIGPVPELALAFETVRHSCIRRRIARAMRATNPDGFRDHFSFECLWDCESSVQQEGVSVVSLDDPQVRNRLQTLASDPHEDEDLRNAARARIAAMA